MINEVKTREEFIRLWSQGERDFSYTKFASDMDLSKLKLDGINLTKATAKGLNLTDSSINNAILNSVFMYNSIMKRTTARNIEAKGAFITHSVVQDSDFESANLKGANLKFIDLEQFKMCNLENANLKGTQLDFFKANSCNIALGGLFGLVALTVGMLLLL